jgi:hypothetical protein
MKSTHQKGEGLGEFNRKEKDKGSRRDGFLQI